MTKLRSCLVVIFLIFYYNQLSAQSLRKSVYNDVIEINDRNAKEIGEHYLCDIPIKNSKKTVTFYNNARIPNKLFFNQSFYPHLKEFMVIAPDWDYFNRVLGIRIGKGGHAKPVRSTIVYRVRREKNGVQVDSVVIRGENQPKLNFQQTADLSEKFVKVYHVDYCGIDGPIEFHTLNEYVDNYQKVNNIKIQNTYGRLDNVLKCTIVYFTLSNLSAREKVGFILERWYSKITEKHLKKIAPASPQIFTPVVMESRRLKIVEF